MTDQDRDVVTLWRPVGPVELESEKAECGHFRHGFRSNPSYPVLSDDYAVKIARDWNVPASGSGYVTRFEVRRDFLENYSVQEAGGTAHLEYWIPAEEMTVFNDAIVGEVVAEFR